MTGPPNRPSSPAATSGGAFASVGQYANPFGTWARLARGLHERFLVELQATGPMSLHAKDVLGMLGAMTTQSKKLAEALVTMERDDRAGFEAFLRALEKS